MKLLLGFLAGALAAHGSGLPAVLLEGWPLRLTCEHRENPRGIGAPQPRLSWWVGDDSPGATQAAYEIAVAGSEKSLSAGPHIWDSGRVASDQSVDVPYTGAALAAEKQYFWHVRTWNAAGKVSDWSETAWWETGPLTASDWQAKWIAGPARDISASAPAWYLRKTFVLLGMPSAVRLYVSARGLVEMRLDGERVGEDLLAPGWTDFKRRNQYLAYDLTNKVTAGVNVLGAILGDGWHGGYLRLKGGLRKNWYGDDNSLLAELVVTAKSGKRTIYGTDASWQVREGPILSSDLYNGETYDARRDLEIGGGTWDAPGNAVSGWTPAVLVPPPPVPPAAKVDYPIRAQEVLRAKAMHLSPSPSYEWVFDFGQDCAGWARFKLMGQAGHTVTLRYSEVLNPDGSLYTQNLRSAKATDRYTFAEDGLAVWEPRFTYHGFRYVGVSGLAQRPDLDAVQAVVVHNDMPETGSFECSDPRLNRLQQNIRWSQKSNAFDVPTDCPQRDERLGWTGDASLYLPTGCFNFDVSAFFEKWMADLRDAQTPEGVIPVYVPTPDHPTGASAYSDAIAICPWVIYERYGDRKILADNFSAMKAWVAYLQRTSDHLIVARTRYGDWLAADSTIPGGPGARDLIGTAYFAWSAELTRRTADVLGQTDDAASLQRLHDGIVAAFRTRYVGADGRLSDDEPTAYALALDFDLLPDNSREPAADRLVALLRARDWKLTTGYIGTPALMRVLGRFHRDEAAYRLLLQPGYPGWLQPVAAGATTIWERQIDWNGKGGYASPQLTSFNHTVWGSVGAWMYSVIGGIAPDPAAPGFKRILIQPRPGGGLTWAKTALDSPYGRIATDWKIADGNFHLSVRIPPNVRASVQLPDGRSIERGGGTYQFDAPLPPPAAP